MVTLRFHCISRAVAKTKDAVHIFQHPHKSVLFTQVMSTPRSEQATALLNKQIIYTPCDTEKKKKGFIPKGKR